MKSIKELKDICDQNLAKTAVGSIGKGDVFQTMKDVVDALPAESAEIYSERTLQDTSVSDDGSYREKVDSNYNVRLQRRFYTDKYDLFSENLLPLELSRYHKSFRFQLRGIQPSPDFVDDLYLRILMKQDYLSTGDKKKNKNLPAGSKRVYNMKTAFKTLKVVKLTDIKKENPEYFEDFRAYHTSGHQMTKVINKSGLVFCKNVETYTFFLSPSWFSKLLPKCHLFKDWSRYAGENQEYVSNRLQYRFKGVRGDTVCVAATEDATYTKGKPVKLRRGLFSKFKFQLLINKSGTLMPVSMPSNVLKWGYWCFGLMISQAEYDVLVKSILFDAGQEPLYRYKIDD